MSVAAKMSLFKVSLCLSPSETGAFFLLLLAT